MKEVTRIHLAKTAYDIEIGAKDELQSYLNSIEKIMNSDDAMREIEARMVELLGDRGVAAGGVISVSDVADLRQKMGEPVEFADSDNQDTLSQDESAERPAKRLMRDLDNALIGGVCAGVAAYLGINPLWVRILFIVSPFVTFGTSLIIYAIMWITMPAANTAAEKLQMRGEEVTFDALKNLSISEEAKASGKKLITRTIQAVLAVGLFFGTLASIIVVMIGIFLGVNTVAWLEGLGVYLWALGLLVSLIIGGAALISIFGILTASAARWRFSPRGVSAMIMCFVIGAIMIASVAIFGGMSAVEFNRDINKATKTIPVELPSDISNVKRVAVESNGAISREFISSSETKVEVDYLDHKTNGVPVVKSMVEGDTLKVEIAGDHGVYCGTLPIILMRDCPSVVSVRVQGPFHSVERYGAGSILVE